MKTNEQGQALAELALVLPMFFLLAVLFLRLFLQIYTQSKLNVIAYDCARATAKNAANAVTSYLTGWVMPGLPGNACTMIPFQWTPYSGESLSNSPGIMINVHASYQIRRPLIGTATIPQEPPAPAPGNE